MNIKDYSSKEVDLIRRHLEQNNQLTLSIRPSYALNDVSRAIKEMAKP